MSFILQWIFISLGLVTTYYVAQWPGFEYYLASLALYFFALAFRCDMKALSN